MRRYLGMAFLIGLLVSAAVVALYRLHFFSAPDRWLSGFFASLGLLPATVASGEPAAWLDWAEMGVICILAMVTAWCIIDIPLVNQKFQVFGALVFSVLALAPTFALYGIYFSPFGPASAILLSSVAGLFYASTEHGQRKRVLQMVLGRRVSRKTFADLMNAGKPINLDGGVREATVLTVRLFNHAELRERMEPADLLAMTNMFLRNTADFLLSRGAYLDESSPDSVRVFFGLLKDSDTHAVDACRVALELRTRLANLNDECERTWFQRLQYGVAISSGSMTFGVYGSQRDFYFSAVGSETDFARRLSAANLRYGSVVLLSPKTYQLARAEIEVRPLEMIYDPDENVMSEMYELVEMGGLLSEDERQRRDGFWAGVVHYRAGRYDEALVEFSKASVPGKDDGPIKFFVEKCQTRLAAGDTKPPQQGKEMSDEGHARLLSTL